MLFYISMAVFVFSLLYSMYGIKKDYENTKPLSFFTSLCVWILYASHFILVFISAKENIWKIPLNETFDLILGNSLIILGLFIMLLGVFEFHSLKRMSGLETSKLITTGIYRYSRNPQNLGWILTLLGISISGYSLLALLFTLIFIIGFHLYVIKLEEPYLERIFGEKYREYKSKTPRYLGIPGE